MKSPRLSGYRTVLLLLMVVIPLITYDMRTASFLGGNLLPVQSGLPLSQLGILRTFDDSMAENDGACGVAWSRSGFLNSGGDRTQLETQVVPMDSVNATVHTTTWTHQRSGAPFAQGRIQATVVHSCSNTTTMHSATAIVTRETVVCADGNDPATVFVIDWSEADWIDILGEPEASSINLWHFHATVFRLWAGVEIGQHVVASSSETNRTVNTNDPPWVVLYVPDRVFDHLQSPANVLLASPENLLELATLSTTTTHLERLQGVADVFHGQLLVLRAEKATMGELHSTLRQQQHVGPDRPRMVWVRPPNDGLMWDLAWDAKLQIDEQCRHSLLDHYRNDILQGLSAPSFPTRNSTRPIAQHICFLSRQRRSKMGSPDRGSLRNLAPEFLLQLLGRLGSALLLTPNTALRTNSSSTQSSLPNMHRISIAEQLQFVYDECAVLLGVHGAGLTNTLGLRPGAAVMELLSATGPSYQYFRNLAQLLPDVDYTRVENLNGTGPHQERDLQYNPEGTNGDDKRLDELQALIERKVQESVQRQMVYSTKNLAYPLPEETTVDL